MSFIVDATTPRISNPTSNDGLRILSFNDQENRLNGSDGDDAIDGGNLDDQIFGSLGNDQIRGKDGNDLLIGGDGDDVIFGGRGNDTMFGNSGNDRLSGQDGDDFIDGGTGDDILTGGRGDDIFNFNFEDGDLGVDKIIDFKPGEDVIRLDGVDPTASIEYDPKTGILAVDGIAIAELDKKLTLSPENFEFADPLDSEMDEMTPDSDFEVM